MRKIWFYVIFSKLTSFSIIWQQNSFYVIFQRPQISFFSKKTTTFLTLDLTPTGSNKKVLLKKNQQKIWALQKYVSRFARYMRMEQNQVDGYDFNK